MSLSIEIYSDDTDESRSFGNIDSAVEYASYRSSQRLVAILRPTTPGMDSVIRNARERLMRACRDIRFD